MENTFSRNVQDTYTTNNYGKQLTQKYENNITNDNFNQSNIHLNRNTGSLYANPIRSDSYDFKQNPSYLTDNYKQRCLFKNDNYNKATQNNDVNFNNGNNFGQFQYENDFKNRPLIDNNLNEAIRLDYIDERDIIIDTINRDLNTYPNIFNFRLKLGSTETTVGPSIHRTINNVKYIKLQKAIFPDNYNIAKNDFNSNDNTHNDLKEVSLDYFNTIWATIYNSVSRENVDDYHTFQASSGNYYKIYIIDHYYNLEDDKFEMDFNIDSSYDGTTDSNIPDYQTVYSACYDNPTSSLDTNTSNWNFYYYKEYEDTQIQTGRYFQLHIDQLPKNNDLATADSVSKSFCLLIPGKEDVRGFNALDGFETDKIFKFSNLGSFNNFNIKITDCVGDTLETNTDIWNANLDNYSNSKKILNGNSMTKSYFKYSFRSPNKYIRHPLSWRQQAMFIFNIGEVNIDMNKKTFN
mgnify:CR=1 FL=1